MFTYVIVIVDDYIQSVNCCELSTVIITEHVNCWLGGCVYTLDCLIGVIPILGFTICGYDQNYIEFVCCVADVYYCCVVDSFFLFCKITVCAVCKS